MTSLALPETYQVELNYRPDSFLDFFAPPKRPPSSSESGQKIDTILVDVQKKEVAAVSMSRDVQLRNLVADIKALLPEYNVADWDGYGAEPIHPLSARFAFQFLQILLSEQQLPLPHDWCPQPNGYLALEWAMNGYHVALSINPDCQIEWGGISPNGQIFGDARFDKKNIPKEIISMLRDISE